MNLIFEELDYRRTPLGELVLRRRTEPRLGVEVYEVKLGDEFLMSSLFTEGEIALARYALAGLGAGPLPLHVLHPSHAQLYSDQGLRKLASHLVDDGVFALWSNDPPDADFCATLGHVFARSEAHVVKFHNPLTGGDAANTVYLGRTAEA